MKNINIILTLLVSLVGCKQDYTAEESVAFYCNCLKELRQEDHLVSVRNCDSLLYLKSKHYKRFMVDQHTAEVSNMSQAEIDEAINFMHVFLRGTAKDCCEEVRMCRKKR